MSGRDLAAREDRSETLARAQVRANELAVEYAEELLTRETKSRRLAWTVTALLIVICAAQAAAIALLMPLKEVVPYTIVVDRSTGFVEQVRSVDLAALPEDEAVTQALLAQYTIARETFDAADFNHRYRLVGLWSVDGARTDYLRLYSPDNPANLNATTQVGAIKRVVVKKVEIIDRATDPKLATIDLTVTHSLPDAPEQSGDWRATIGFRYTGASMRMEDRLMNPLGFQVVSYRLDAPPLAATAVAAPTPTPQTATKSEAAATPPAPLAPNQTPKPQRKPAAEPAP